MSLRVRTFLIAAFAIASMTPLVVFWLWPYSGILNNKYDEVHERHLLLANNLGAALETYHRDVVGALESFAPEIAQGRGRSAEAIFLDHNFRHVCVVKPETGKVIRSYLTEEHACLDQIPAERLALFERLAAGPGVGMSRVFAPEGERPRIYFATRTGSFLIVAAIHTDFFKLLQQRINFGRRGHAAIVDHTGRVLAHPSAEWERTAYDMSQISAVQRIKAGETGVEMFYSPVMGADMIAGFTTVAGSGWGVLVPQPISELEEAANEVNRDALIVLSVGLILSFAMAAWASTIFSKKIEVIARHVRQVGEGVVASDHKRTRTLIGISELTGLLDGVDRMARATIRAREESHQHNLELEQANTLLRREIAEREAAEAGRKGSEARFRGLFERAPIPVREEDLSGIKAAVDGLGIADAKILAEYLEDHPEFVQRCGDMIVVVDANRASMELHGFSDQQELLANVTRTLSPESLEVVRKTIMAIHAGETQLSYQIPVYTLEGEVRHVASSWTTIAGHETTYRRILLTSIDLTERVKSEERLLKAQKMEAVGQLTGGIAHDFNNLLTVIGGNADLIQADLINAREYVHPIQRAVLRGSELTQRLLAFSRKQPLAPKNVDLVELLSEVTEILRRTLGENVAIDLSFATDLWTVLADPNQVENAVLNLGLNARDAMPNGGNLSITCQNVSVAGRDSDELKDGDYVAIDVTDNGTGMTNNELSHAFEPFFTTKAVGKGSGLGLSMVYGFAKQSNGHAEIESRLDQGTTVRILLPRSKIVFKTPEAPVVTEGMPQGDGQRVLVLEDQDDVRTYLVHLLDLLGYEVLPAGDAHAAKVILDQASDVRVALCDIMLPGGISGTEFAAEAMKNDPSLKVIFISGYPPVDGIPQSDQSGNSVLLIKPFDSKRLGDLLYEYHTVS